MAVCDCVCARVCVVWRHASSKQPFAKSLVQTQCFNHFVARLVHDTDDAGPEVRCCVTGTGVRVSGLDADCAFV